MSTSYSLFVVFGFLAVVLLLEGLFMFWTETKSPEVKRIQRRLKVMAVGKHRQSDVTLLKQRLLSMTPGMQRILVKVPKIHQLDRLLLQAGSNQTVSQLLTVCMLAGVGGFLVGTILDWSAASVLLVPVALAAAPVLRLLRMRALRVQQISAQLPDALDMIARALRAGHAFPSALAMVGDEAQDPIASEFKTTFDEINFGITTPTALLNLASRVPIADLRYFVLAVMIQLETGGNLAELLTMLAKLIRARFKLLGKVRVLAAEGKLSAYILIGLPFFMAAVLHVINPEHMDLLFTDPMGIRMVITSLVMMVVGSFLMWRIIDIHV